MGKVLVAGLALVLCFTTSASADMVSPGVNFGAAGDSFTADLTASGSATVGGSGTYYSWLGWPASSWASVTISFNNQTVGLGTNPDTINVAKDPTGTGQVSFERLFTTFDGRTLDTLDIDLLGGTSQGLALDQVKLTGDAGGLVDVELRLDTTGSVTNLDFTATTLQTFGTNGQHPISVSTVLGVGDADATISAAIDAEIEIMGLFTIDLGNVLSINESITEQIPYLATMTLTELGTTGVYPKDVSLHLATSFDEAINVPFTTAGANAVNTYGGNKNPYYKMNVSYDFDGQLTVDNVGINLYDTITGIIPEPMTLAVFGLGGGLLALARRRR